MNILSYQVPTRSVLFASVDGICAFLSMCLAVLVYDGFPWELSDLANGRVIFSALTYAVVVTLLMAAMGLYDPRQRYGLEGVQVRVVIGLSLALLASLAIGFMLEFILSRLIWLLAFAFSLLLVVGAKYLADRYMDDELFRRRVLVYGAGKRAGRITELRRRSDQRGFKIVGFVPSESDNFRLDDPRVITSLECSLLEYAQAHDVSEIVVASDDRRKGFPIEELLECKLSGIQVVDLLEFLERETGRVKVDILNPSWLIFSESFNRRNRERVSFKILDMIIAAVALVVAVPILLVVAALVISEDGRPVLYRQQRTGYGGRTFTLYKFRSMRKDAETAGEAVWAEEDDPRVTRVGKWLRKFRLDELPQLINVLKGEMSIVGPRPERPEFVEGLTAAIPYYQERHYVKPGITGWAQLCYRYGSTEDDALAKLEFDLYYIKNRSVVFYLMILLQTAEVILWRKGSR